MSETSISHIPSIPWNVNIITLFPEMYPGPLGYSLSGKALDKQLFTLNTIQLRDFGIGKHKNVDDVPCGGGAGMVIRPDVVDAAIQSIPHESKGTVIYLSPRGKPLQQSDVASFIHNPLTILCGRFEGVDQRVLDHHRIREVSIGDYVLSNGDIAAFVLLDACTRLLPGFMNDPTSWQNESFQDNLLEHPLYTSPRSWNDKDVPDVLLSGHHAKIAQWRVEQSLMVTQERRPDLLIKKK
jgi:tRNA (guanine37-N1)-methyltransferase